MFNTNSDFYLRVRASFPELAERADWEYLKYWEEAPKAEEAYSWFGSVANALNKEMRRGLFLAETGAFFDYVNSVLSRCSDEVENCIDVSLVENLFWEVSPTKAALYWAILPSPLQKLYLEFHGRPPTP